MRRKIAPPALLLACFVALTTSLGIKASVPSPTLRWERPMGVSIPIPPKERPRLYLRSEHLPDVRQRMNHPELQTVWQQLQEMRHDWNPKDIPTVKDFRYYQNQKGATVRAQLDALEYLLSHDKTTARRAIESTLDTLQRLKVNHHGDVSRTYGIMLVVGATVYDWCYDQLTAVEKQQFIRSFVGMAEKMECGYPPLKQGSVTGHSSEWMIMRDLLSAGIAIYDEFPDLYHYTASRFFSQHLPARNYFYLGQNYHQGSSYIDVRMTNDLFALWIFDRMGAGSVYVPQQQYVMYDCIYRRRPDGQVISAGDANYTRTEVKSYALPAFLAASYYGDPYLQYEYERTRDIEPHCRLFEFLWRDPELKGRSPQALPLTRSFGTPFGWAIARTGWDDNSVIAEMKINEFNFSNHQHLDAGTFQIYYKGPLAIDAGAYTGSSGGYNSPHNKNFFKRTIAHNGLLIYDPQEKFSSKNYGGENQTPFAANDGGQRMPGTNWGECMSLDALLNTNFETGKSIASAFGPSAMNPDYTYLKGDITAAYSSKVTEVKRSFVFLNLKNKQLPAAMIVFDKVVAKNPQHKKFWLLHSIEQPLVEGATTTIRRTQNGDSGVLHNTTLLPAKDNVQISSVGGRGKEFWVFGENYSNDRVPSRPDQANERGEWRIEVSPRAAAATDYFLNVLQVSDGTTATLPQPRLIETKELTGVELADRLVFFSRNQQELNNELSFAVEGKGRKSILMTDLSAGIWTLIRPNNGTSEEITVRNDERSLFFMGEAGNYRLRKMK